MAWRLRALTAFAEDPHHEDHNYLNSCYRRGETNVFFWLGLNPVCGVHRYTQTHVLIHKINTSLKKK